ncbi:MAG: hypothetical protein IPP32_14580 [Bacteroidetes bacterium]|nr:hypothetical protein [Bacteroidota bacterium]
MTEDKFKTEKINGDVVSILQLTSKIGWKETRELSILRILYLTSILFRFRYPNDNNPFEEDYEFTVDSRGPYNDKVINNSLVWLLSNEMIKQSESQKAYSLTNKDIPFIEQIPNFNTKREWIDAIIHILGIYGEDNIYDFVFRDPEYRDTVDRQSTKTINLSESNKTIETLHEFQKAFIEALGDKAKDLNPKDYLEMYFEFIFSKYLKGKN